MQQLYIPRGNSHIIDPQDSSASSCPQGLPPNVSTKLFISNCPHDVADADVYELFQKWKDQIMSITWAFNDEDSTFMGYGWVDFSDIHASAAAQQLNGSQIRGHDILISFSQPKRAMDEDPPCPHKEWSDWKRLRQKNGLQHFVCIQCGAKWKRATQARKENEKMKTEVPRHPGQMSYAPTMQSPGPQSFTLLQQQIQAAIRNSAAAAAEGKDLYQQIAAADLGMVRQVPQQYIIAATPPTHLGTPAGQPMVQAMLQQPMMYQMQSIPQLQPPPPIPPAVSPSDRFVQILGNPQMQRIPQQVQQQQQQVQHQQHQQQFIQQFGQPPAHAAVSLQSQLQAPSLQVPQHHPLLQQQLQLQQLQGQMQQTIPNASQHLVHLQQQQQQQQHQQPRLLVQQLQYQQLQQQQQQQQQQHPAQPPAQHVPLAQRKPKQLTALGPSQITIIKRLEGKDGMNSPVRSAFHLSAANDVPVPPAAQSAPTCAPTRPGALPTDSSGLHQADFFFSQQGSLLLPSNLTTFDLTSLSPGQTPIKSPSFIADVPQQHLASSGTPQFSGQVSSQPPGGMQMGHPTTPSHRMQNQHQKPKSGHSQLAHFSAHGPEGDRLGMSEAQHTSSGNISRDSSVQFDIDWIRVQFEDLLRKITEGFAEAQIDPSSHVIHKLAAQKAHFEWFNKLTEDANMMIRSLATLYMAMLPPDSVLYNDMQALKYQVKGDKWFA